MKYQKLIDLQKKAKAELEAYIENNLTNLSDEQKVAKELLRNHEQVLYRLGERKPKQRKPSTPARKNPFKKRILTDGEKGLIAKNSKIDNSNAPKDAFKKKEGAIKKAKVIDNSNAPKKNKFKKEKESVVPSPEKKQGPKFKGRLNKDRKMKILDLHGEGKTPLQISQELWIEEKTILKFLKLPVTNKAKNNVVIADNAKEGLDKFVDEVKESE